MKKTTFLILAIIFTGSLWAQESFSLKMDHVALSVKDLDQSIDFYTNVLKLHEITNLTRKEGIRWVSLGDGKELHLVSTIKEPVTINKAVHLAFKTVNFDALIQVLVKRNITFSDWPGIINKITVRADGIKQIYFQDPDGYWIEVNSVTLD
ncbi:VOC family protein [Flavobacterium xinjiangense]|uniref:Catechol 2,3-dioxygenase n=1 Tax=Flavobacterium xinjiangense TaxID=178356 RepID=A0A1M7D5C1_9FLAO|nr:VOC family protein [Flavobacterium xinjiangense]SHL74645.1 Catechol 2,3-dioxygenase [Flavobacterium xinjiangense]